MAELGQSQPAQEEEAAGRQGTVERRKSAREIDRVKREDQ